ncbi:hypothetical protein M8C13_07000 [Crossiella sp. SN42]|uniref:hypothetical protein n=1 Tax=Crossiella sp. SN42 TaxID=2944808 RepID=UPI00207D6568|nr:hypothetical protein [Crossiella sp. SN42]MCO1575504.1 hypothetical protein [Crossiella sp. SN42]
MMWPVKHAVSVSLNTQLRVYQFGEDAAALDLARKDGVRSLLGLIVLLEKHRPDEDGLCERCATDDRPVWR